MTQTEQLIKNFARVRERIATASGGREVVLQAATKTIPAESINLCAEQCALRVIGENRVQELLDKYDQLDRSKLEIHFIGTLQRNKVRKIIDKVDMIESVDSLPLAAEIDRQAEIAGKIMPVLVEINIGRELEKGGVMPDEMPEFLHKIMRLKNISVRGFMTMAPKCRTQGEYAKYFEAARQISLDNRLQICDNLWAGNLSDRSSPVLSMGMSDSYVTAVLSGATTVRVGNALFK